MQTNREELIDVLKAVKPGLASKEIIEQSTSFVFRGGSVYTYNDEIMISHPIGLDIEGAVQAQQLYDLLNKCKDEEIEIKTTKSELTIKGVKFKAGIRLDAEINLPIDEIPMPKKREWVILPEGFTEGVRNCLFSVGTDMSKPILTCIHMILPLIESCDNQRLTQYMLDSEIIQDGTILLPARTASVLINYPVDSYAVSEGWVHFKVNKGAIISCRTMEGEYPSLKKLIRISGESITFPTDMIETLERAEVMSETEITRERTITIMIEKNAMVVKSQSKAGWYEESFRIRYSGSQVMFNINAQFLKEILRHLRKAEIDEQGGRLKFTGDRFVHIIALVKAEKELDVEPF